MLRPALLVTRRAHSSCGCAALQTKDQDNELLVRKLKERFERCATPPELPAAHLCTRRAGRVAAWAMPPCQGKGICCGASSQTRFGQRVVVCRVDLKMPTVTVQYSSLGVNATVHVGSRALPSCLELLQEHGGGETLSSCLHRNVMPVCLMPFAAKGPSPVFKQMVMHVCPISSAAGPRVTTTAAHGVSAQLTTQPQHQRLISKHTHILQRVARIVRPPWWCLQSALIGLWLMKSHKRPFTILKDVSGAIKPVLCLSNVPCVACC